MNTEFLSNHYAGTAPAWRDWGSKYSAAFLACGLTLEDTDIDWLTATNPGGVNSLGGYEVWKFPDPTGDAADVYLLCRYGTGSSSVRPVLRIRVGTSWTADDAIGGPGASATWAQLPGNSINGGDYPTWMSSDGDGLAIVNMAGYAQPSAVVIDRPRLEDGSTGPRSGFPTPGVFVANRVLTAGSVATLVVHVDPVAKHARETTRWPAIAPTATLGAGASYANVAGDVVVMPTIVSNKQGFGWSKMGLSYPAGDALADVLADVAWLDETRTYRTTNVTGVDHRTQAGSELMIWWEDP